MLQPLHAACASQPGGKRFKKILSPAQGSEQPVPGVLKLVVTSKPPRILVVTSGKKKRQTLSSTQKFWIIQWC